jgi:ABC-type multidrug transport system fused ATPase/permease subunit
VSKVNELRIADPAAYRELCNDSLSVRDMAKQLKLTYSHLRKKKHPLGWLLASSLFLLVTVPVFLIGFILNIIIFKVSEIQSLKSKDPAFISTARFGFFLGLGLVFAPLFLILALILIKPWWLGIIVFFLVPVLGVLAWNWSLLFRRTVGGFRIRSLRSTQNQVFTRLRETYDNLTQRVAKL